MLKLNEVTKSFTGRGIVLDRLVLEINESDSISITGPSGSGKTTLLSIAGSLSKPDEGDVIFRGSSVLRMTSDESAAYRNRNIGFIFQDHLLLPHLTVKENIMLPVAAFRRTDEEISSAEEYASVLMDETGIKSLADKYPFQISGGEAQRASMVRALINRPDILLADEPTGSLDKKNASILGDLMTKLNREFAITLLVVTHSAELASKMTIQYKLENGKLTV